MRFICLFIFPFLIYLSDVRAQSAKAVFQKMFDANKKIQTISYNVRSKVIGGPLKDSVHSFRSYVKATKVKEDSLYGFHFNIEKFSSAIRSDIYYDGTNKTIVYHIHPEMKYNKSIVVSKACKEENYPQLLKSIITIDGFINELIMQEFDNYMLGYLDSMKVYDSEKSWIIQWEETNSEENIIIQHQLVINKNTYQLTEINRRSVKNGVPYKAEVIITDILLNEIGLPPFFKYRYLDYTMNSISTPCQN